MLFQQDWSLIEECIAAGMAPPDEKLACNQGSHSAEISSLTNTVRFSSGLPTALGEQESAQSTHHSRVLSTAHGRSTRFRRQHSPAIGDEPTQYRSHEIRPARFVVLPGFAHTHVELLSLDNGEDVVSELTIGPAFQGNLTKILRARKQQQQSQTSDTTPVKPSEKAREPSPSTHLPATTAALSTSMSNHPLMNEINEWKIEHNR